VTAKEQTKLLKAFMAVVKELGRIPKELDILLGSLFTHELFGGFDVSKARTISSMMGEEQAKILYDEWDRKSVRFYPWIPLNHVFSQLLTDICEVIQPWHCLVSIQWKVVGHRADLDYPGIRKVVEDFLRLQGVRV
jgi:hypothetical protein